ncbi:TPA: hypothetical protein L4E70_006484 [Pseudomonas aeruginosa]|nr:hypothetical protein [Pseudomonas aeruginosa]HBO1118233.1 hypothetical protein [Pseudomonas aeruginosa]
MINGIRNAVLFLGFIASFQAYAWNYNLIQDMGVSGAYRYCKYNNGKVYTVNAAEICQISISDSSPGFGTGKGFLKGEYADGMSKVCVYNVLGQEKAIRISSVSICPATADF